MPRVIEESKVRPALRYAFACLAIASTLAYGLFVGPYMIIDAIVFAMFSLVILLAVAPMLGLRDVPLLSWTEKEISASRVVPRPEDAALRPTARSSRIAYYDRVSKIRDPKVLEDIASNPFTHTLFKEPNWPRLSAAQLRDVVHRMSLSSSRP